MFIELLEELKREQDVASVQLRIYYEGLERLKKAEEVERKELELREKEGQALNESERMILNLQIKLNEATILLLQKAKENMMRLVEEQDRENIAALKIILEHEAKLHEKQVLELQVYKDGLAKMYMKRMEELDREQFMNAVKVKYGSAGLEKAVELCSLWEGYLSDPSWLPYKVVMVGENDEAVLDENDDKLKELKNEYGEEAYEVVMKALNKFNEHCPSGSNPVPPEMRYSSEKRTAVKEGVARVLSYWKNRIGKENWKRN